MMVRVASVGGPIIIIFMMSCYCIQNPRESLGMADRLHLLPKGIGDCVVSNSI